MTAATIPEVQALQRFEAEQLEARPVPDLAILRSWRKPAPDFPLDMLGERWSRWVQDAAAGSGCPVGYSATGLLAFAAGAAGNAVLVSPWPGWAEPCILWTCNVGESSDGKSPALDPHRRAVDQLEAKWSDPFAAELEKWQADTVIAKARRQQWDAQVQAAVKAGEEPPAMPPGCAPPPEPGRPRLRMSDSTPEALAAVLVANPRGVVLLRDELAAWLGSFGRYTGGAAGDRGLWLEAYGGRSHTIDRIKSGATRIERLAVTIVGSATPDRLVALAMDSNDGLAARFLWCWPEPLPPTIPRSSADVEALETGLSWLHDLPMPNGDPVLLRLEPEAVETFQRWRVEHAETTRGTCGLLGSAYGKAPGTVLRLALVLELLEAAGRAVPVPGVVSTGSLLRALGLWDAFYRPMAERTLGDASVPERDRDAATLAQWIARDRPATVNARTLYREVRLPGLTEPSRANRALESLVEAGWLDPRPSRAGDNPGRNRADFTVRHDLLATLDNGRPR